MRRICAGLAAAFLVLTAQAQAAPKDTVTIGMILEPPGLDPTAGAAAAIGEIAHDNIFECLTKINADNSVTPQLADSWTVSDDLKTYTFKLKSGITFQNGEPFTAADVKFSFERAAAADSTNKIKAFFQTIDKIETPDPSSIAITLKQPNPDVLFDLGMSPSVIVEPKSAGTNATKPVGTGPFKFDSWVKGSSVTLTKWDGYRAAKTIALNKVTFRIINDPAAQVAALLAGDVDAFPRFGSFESVAQFQSDPRFTVTVGGTEGKTILAMNNKKKPLDDVRVRQAIAYAIDRKAVIDGAQSGYGTPIGSHMVPGDPGYVDLTAAYPYDPEKSKSLLKATGVALPLQLTLQLPPPPYARQGGEIIAAELAQVGIETKIENIEWAQWLSGVYTNKNYDLTVISHVEPLDIGIYANPNYYFNYDSKAFQDLYAKISTTADPQEHLKLLGDAQRMLVTDCVNAFLFQLPQVTIANKNLHGLWKNSPIFVNDMSAVSWE
ncbi:ABC transporter substrate-binding protein [Methylovirgula sp. 4M-Z18]|uniref:ABC transporter substrate-binding protein n=1 Tax=Methylovirgula sp. 4M-Z18 TaxID=2293567 RepID=UPI000E2F725A|nr:ABC transporter substrate-binding protein [Methylovirgula sp. 4M-Z18]RFB81283.1 ABC transporter substrate-binding protein [Methylovirgula sp. 4M-Z18]